MKKSLVLLLASVAFAQESNGASFNGAYIGGQAGLNSSATTVVAYQNSPLNGYHSCNGVSDSKKLIGGLFAGYGHSVTDNVYLGGELYFNLVDNNSTIFDTSSNSSFFKSFKIRKNGNSNYGAKLRLGYVVTPQTMIFAGCGLENENYSITVTDIQTLVAQDGVETVTKKKYRTFTVAPFVGAEIQLTDHVFARGEYTYVLGKVKRFSAPIKTGRALLTTSEFKEKTDQHRFVLGCGYRF